MSRTNKCGAVLWTRKLPALPAIAGQRSFSTAAAKLDVSQSTPRGMTIR
jgi:hypothetical protein